MPRHPAADNRREFTKLNIQSAVGPRRHAHSVFVQSDLRAAIAWIEPAIESRLHEEINLGTNLGIEKEREPRTEQIVNRAVDESRRRLLKMVILKVERAAQPGAKLILPGGNRERAVEPVENIIDINRAGSAGKEAQAECVPFHAGALSPSATRKRASNSVQSFSERTSRKSTPCNRARLRARFNPI